MRDATTGSGPLTGNTLVVARTAGKGTVEIISVNVVVAGSAAGSVHDASTVASASSSNQIASTPTTIGSQYLRYPAKNGIVVKPGSGQTISLSYHQGP